MVKTKDVLNRHCLALIKDCKDRYNNLFCTYTRAAATFTFITDSSFKCMKCQTIMKKKGHHSFPEPKVTSLK